MRIENNKGNSKKIIKNKVEENENIKNNKGFFNISGLEYSVKLNTDTKETKENLNNLFNLSTSKSNVNSISKKEVEEAEKKFQPTITTEKTFIIKEECTDMPMTEDGNPDELKIQELLKKGLITKKDVKTWIDDNIGVRPKTEGSTHFPNFNSNDIIDKYWDLHTFNLEDSDNN